MKQFLKISLMMLIAILLVGCAAPKRNVSLSESFWKNTKHEVAIAKTKFDKKPSLHRFGQQGILEYAVSSAVTSKFSKYLQKTNMDWYEKFPQKFVAQFKKRNIASNVYSADLNSKQKKNATVAIQMEGNKVLLLELLNLGATRKYYSFFPGGAPKAYCVLKGELIDRQNKKILWSHFAKIEEPVRGDWDQPPSYPNFTLALKQAVDSAQEEVIDSFFSGH